MKTILAKLSWNVKFVWLFTKILITGLGLLYTMFGFKGFIKFGIPTIIQAFKDLPNLRKQVMIVGLKDRL